MNFDQIGFEITILGWFGSNDSFNSFKKLFGEGNIQNFQYKFLLSSIVENIQQNFKHSIKKFQEIVIVRIDNFMRARVQRGEMFLKMVIEKIGEI